MAGAIAEAYVEIKPDTKGFGRALSNDVDGSIDKESGNLTGAGKKAGGLLAAGVIAGTAAAGIAFGAFTAFSVGAASDLNESINAVSVTFGEAGTEILKLGENAATSVGLSNNEFNGLAVQFSSFADKIAGPGGDVVATIDDITTRAADFASVMNLEVADAATIFQAGLAGETEGLKRFGIDLSDANIKAYAAANGIGTLGEELTEAEKVQARYGSLMEQTNKTQGDFANTADSMANGLRILKSQAQDTAAVFGSAFLPGIGSAIGAFNELLPALEPVLADLGTSISGALTPLIDAIGPALQQILPAIVAIFGDIGTVIGALAPVIQPVVAVIAKLATTFSGVLSTAIVAIAPIITQLAQTIAGVLFQAIGAIMPIFQQLAPIFAEIAALVGDVLNEVISILAEVLLSLFEAIAPLIPILADAFLTVLQALAPILVQVAEMIALMAQEMIAALVPVLPVLVELILALLEALLPLLPALLQIVEALLPVFVQLVQQLSPLLVTLVEILIATLVPAVNAVVTAMTWWIENVLVPIYTFIGNQFQPVLSGLADIARAVGDAFVAMGGWFQDVWTGTLQPIYNWFADLFAPVFADVGSAADDLATVFSTAMNVLDTIWTSVVKPIYNWFKNIFGDAFDAAGDAVSGLGDVFGNVFDSIVEAVDSAMGLVKKAINTIIRGWNSLEFDVPKIDLGPLGSIGGGEFGTRDIPLLANGMIGYSPMIAKLFEDGPEAVIPLSSRRSGRADQLMEQSGLADRVRGGRGTVIEFSGGQTFVDGTDADLVAQKTSAALTAMAG